MQIEVASVTTHPLANIALLTQRLQAGTLDAAAYVALYVLHWQVARHGCGIAQRRSRRDAAPNGIAWLDTALTLPSSARNDFLVDIFARYELRGVRQRVGVTLRRWLRGDWRLTLLHSVPSPRAVLRLQADGSRPVTVIATYPRLLQPVLDKTDAYEFVCHDLEHAWQFFHDSARCRAQQRFARRLERAWALGVFDSYLADSVFAEKFLYLAADMNTHVLHSLNYLRAILIEHHLRRDALPPSAPLPAAARAAVETALALLLGDAAPFFATTNNAYGDAAALEAAL